MKNKTNQPKRDKQMTKADMIETILNDAVKRYKEVERIIAIFGKDSQEAKEYRHEWAQSFSMVMELGLLDEYLKKIGELEQA